MLTKQLVSHCLLGILFLQGIALAEPPVDSAALPVEHRSGGPHLYGPPPPPLPGPAYGPPHGHGGPGPGPGYGPPGIPDDPWPLATPDMPQIKHLQVQCEKTHMRVNIEFDRPFYGMIFSKGHYSDPHCVHLQPGSGHLSATFEIFLNKCGMSSSANAHGGYGPTPSGSYVENTIIMQYDPLVQEVWDQARKLRCTWYDFYEKAVTFRPFQVDMLHAVTANFLGDNLQCWMQIQVGKGPWASEVSGIVKIGQTMTMVLAIKDDENKFDMLVRNCVAHDGKRAPIQLVDQYGCVTRPKIMSKFQKIKNFGPSASVVSFAYFQAFKFPDSMNVHFQCVIQVCRYNCPEPKCGGDYGPPPHGEYGPPGLPHGEYGPPPSAEYGPPAFPDPRHPAGPAGAYSENKPNIVPAPVSEVNGTTSKIHGPQALNGPPPPPKSGPPPPPKSGPGPLHKHHFPPLPHGIPPHLAKPANFPLPLGYSVKREGVADGESNLAALGGSPRSHDGESNLAGARRRRNVIVPRIYKREAQEMTDVETERVIQVVAPGDVNFNLNAGSNETVVVQQAKAVDSESICMSVPSFVGGLVMLLLVLIVACIVAAFLFVRVRQIDRKGATTTFVHGGYENAEFVKVGN